MDLRHLARAIGLTVGLAIAGAGTVEAQQTEAPAVAKAARSLPRGAVLQAEDFVLASAATTDVGPIGWVTRRVVDEGEPLEPPTIAPPEVVRSGDPVQLIWASGSLELRVRGRAMNSAAVGERVRVRVDTNRRFEGTALGAGSVRLDPQGNGR